MRFRTCLMTILAAMLFASAGQAAGEFPAYGKASWYGSYHHGKKTASGEKFDMHELTAAHKFLPFGTLLKVVNLKNGKEVIVMINDRGPFSKKRIIDLSRAAAEKIGLIERGTARVRVDVLSLPDGSGYDL